jgi:hypothetical protein
VEGFVLPLFFALLLNLLLCFLMGLGLALTLAKPGMEIEPWEGFCLAPVLGLALEASLAIGLSMLGLAYAHWAWPITLILLVTSLAAALRVRDGRIPRYSGNWVAALGLLAVAVMLAGPVWLGRLKFALSSATFGDNIFMASLSRALQSPGPGALQQASIQAVVSLRPDLALGRIGLFDRWGAPALLGWQSTLSGSSELCLLPFLLLEALLICFPLGYVWLRRCGASKAWATLASAASVTGFWAGLAQDMDALAHLAALPVMLALGLLMASQAKRKAVGFWLMWAVLGFLFHALILLYVELAALAALALPWLVLFVERRQRRAWLAGFVFSLLVALAVNPWGIWHHLLFLWHQWGANQPGVPDLHAFLYDWIKGPPAWASIGRCVWGYWSFGSLQAWAVPFQSLGDIIGIAGLLPMAGALAWSLRARRQPAMALSLLATAGLLLGFGGLLMGSNGAAGKFFHYSGFFNLLLLGLVPLSFHGFSKLGRLSVLLTVLVLVGQMSQPLIRAHLAATRDFRPLPYPSLTELGVGTNMLGDELQPLRDALRGHEQELLMLDVGEAIRHYILESFGPSVSARLIPFMMAPEFIWLNARSPQPGCFWRKGIIRLPRLPACRRLKRPARNLLFLSWARIGCHRWQNA